VGSRAAVVVTATATIATEHTGLTGVAARVRAVR
jgi:hypothetical protein